MTAPATDYLLAAKATGNDPDDWSVVATLLGDSTDITSDRALDWTFQPYVNYVSLADGTRFGRGSPVVTWTFRALRPLQREALRDFCLSLSSEVYIRTPTNEYQSGARVWRDYLCTMLWTPAAEIIGVNAVEDVQIIFRNCLDVTPS